MPVTPGVYVSEAPLPRSITSPAPTQSVAAFLGTALYGPTSPVLVEGWTEFVSKFGGFGRNMTLPMALNQFFLNSGTAAYVCRVVDSSATKSTGKYTDGGTPAKDMLVFTAITPGGWGDSLSVRVKDVSVPNATFTIEVLQDVLGVPVVKEQFVRLSLNKDSARYVESIVNSSTVGSTLLKVVTTADASMAKFVNSATPIDLTGGKDQATTPTGFDYKTAFKQFDSVDSSLIVNIPKGSNDLLPGGTPDGTSILEQVQTRGDSVLIVDPPENTTVANLIISTSIPSASTYAAVYHPWLYVPDPDPEAPRGSIVKTPPGASVAGMILRVDRGPGGVSKAPAGVVAGLAAVATETKFTNFELDLLSQNNINPIRPIPGVGVAVMGARVRAKSGEIQYISVRRLINYIKKQAVSVSRFAIFEPNTPSLWEQLRVVNGVFLSGLHSSGALVGRKSSDAFYVKCDASINTPTSIAAGEVNIEIGVAPVYPAEFVIIRVAHFESGSASVATEEV